MKKVFLWLVAIILIGTGVVWLVSSKPTEKTENAAEKSSLIAEASAGQSGAEIQVDASGTEAGDGESAAAAPEAEGGEEQSEEDRRAEAEERLVEEFDAETDRWMDAESTKPPTMKEVEAYRVRFKGLPKDRKEECLQRALNLVPDENVMLLAGILMDKTEDKALVELVYNDILNRDEEVKKPILQTIFKDKEHPCWADTAWILDVTGETPATAGKAKPAAD